MSLHRPVLSALAVATMLPLFGVGTAEAAFIRRSKVKEVINACGGCSSSYRVMTVVGGAVPFYTVTVEAVSPAGDEDVPLEETDAWLHGTAALPALPATDATVALTLYDTASASLMSFSGVLGADGTVTLAADPAPVGADPTCTSRTGCDTGDTSTRSLDIEVLAVEVFGATGAYDVGFDLAGADTFDVAYATFTVTEGEEVVTCDGSSRTCTTSGRTTTRVEVDWDEIGSVWEGDLTLAHEGLIEVKAIARDAEGAKLEAAKSKLGVPWTDGGDGMSVLTTDEDPLTSVGLLPFATRGDARTLTNSLLTVASSGWSADKVPVDAQVELTDGGTITIPVNSYHRPARRKQYLASLRTDSVNSSGPGADIDERVVIRSGDVLFVDQTVSTLDDSPVCVSGGCFQLVVDDTGEVALAVSAYSLLAADLPDELSLTVTLTDADGAELSTEDVFVDFDDDITAVFANAIGFSEDPVGLDVTGKVKLLGAPNRKGKQSTLAKGKFYGSVSRDGDGDLTLDGADKDTVSPRGDAVVAGDALAFELTRDTNGDGTVTPPPLAFGVGGKVTKIVVSSGGLGYSI